MSQHRVYPPDAELRDVAGASSEGASTDNGEGGDRRKPSLSHRAKKRNRNRSHISIREQSARADPDDPRAAAISIPATIFDRSASNTPHAEPSYNEMEEDSLRRKLAFNFMNPYQKWLASGQWPWKLTVQTIKIILVTIQLVTFAQSRLQHITYVQESSTVLRHVMLRNWTDTRDVIVYPPAAGPYGVYTTGGLEEALSQVVLQYYHLNTTLFNKFEYAPSATEPELQATSDDGYPPMRLTLVRHALGVEHPSKGTFMYDMHEVTEVALLSLNQGERETLKGDSSIVIEMIQKKTNLTISSSTMLTLKVEFTMRTLRSDGITPTNKPNCMEVEVDVKFDNREKSGFVKINLDNDIEYVYPCKGVCLRNDYFVITFISTILIDVFVALSCVISLVLCSRNLYRSNKLRKRTELFFATSRGVVLSSTEKSEFVNGWYIIIVLNDVLIIFGTMFKATIEFQSFASALFTAASAFLGVGTLLVYAGLLRYFSFFNRYNILMLTLKRSLPNCGRFLVCTIIIYAGFMLCGWVILGPYSLKFASIWDTFATMFSLINGDDMFATFYTISDKMPGLMVAFARLYLVAFISLFIYVVLSLFISIIMDAYEVVKDRHDAMEDCNDVSRIKVFITQLTDTPRTGDFGQRTSYDSIRRHADSLMPPRVRFSGEPLCFRMRRWCAAFCPAYYDKLVELCKVGYCTLQRNDGELRTNQLNLE